MIFSYSGPDLLTDELLFLKKFMPLFGHSLNELANEKKIVTFNVVIETVEVKKICITHLVLSKFGMCHR